MRKIMKTKNYKKAYYDERENVDNWWSNINTNNMTATLELFDNEKIEIPIRFDVCPLCEGKGFHVDPSIDSHGISSEEFTEDPDFAEEYNSGSYNQRCNMCNGKCVIPVPRDNEAQILLDKNIKDQKDNKPWSPWSDPTSRAEMQMGA
jgi:hypothetical protein